MAHNFISEDNVNKGLNYKALFMKLWPYIRRHRLLFFFVLLLVFLLAFVSRTLPFLIGYAVDHGFKANNPQVLYQVATAYLVLELVKMALSFSYKFFFQVLGNRTLYHLRQDLFHHVQSLPIEYYNKTPVGRLVTRMTNDTGTLGEVFSEGVVTLFTQVAILISIIVAMILISPKLTLLTVLSTPLFVWLSYVVSQKIKVILREQKKKLSELNSYVAETLSGIKVVQLYHQEPKVMKGFFNHSEDFRKQNIRSIRTSALMQPTLNLLNAFVIGAALYFAGRESLIDNLAVGSMVAFILHAQDIVGPIREVLDKYQMFQNSLTSGERVFGLLDEKMDEKTAGTEKLMGAVEKIEFKNVTFQYQPHLPKVLTNFNLVVTPRTSVALVGRTGSGKTTVISLLQRFYEAPSNTLFINGNPMENYSKESIRARIGVVQQDPFIFKGSLLQNITLFDDSITREQVQQACDLIHYTKYLQRTGRSLDFVSEEKGANLSAGEKQVLAFLRVLVSNPDVIILDEATAQIDSATEDLIQTATELIMQEKMCIIIAHRLSTVQKCNQILVLDHGNVIERGTHSELMDLKGHYHQLALAGVKFTSTRASAAGIEEP
ncbi:MAG: ABC transporter ATP-binding protein [Bdellovibrionota bacterium]